MTTLRRLKKTHLQPAPTVRDSMMHGLAMQLVIAGGIAQRSFYMRCAYGTDEVPPQKIIEELEDVGRRAGALLAMLRSEGAQ